MPFDSNINVRKYIQENYTPYEGDCEFLSPISDKTKNLFDKVNALFQAERAKNGVLGMDTRVSGINEFNAGYVDKELEVIVGLQTDQPLVRAYMPYGGIRTAIGAAAAYNIETDKNVDNIFLKYRKTHNQGVFDAYTEEMRKARHTHIITGLPDNYARGRIIGDYRRIALYGIDFLIQEKNNDKKQLISEMDEKTIRVREEISQQIIALGEMKKMAATYGYDISKPATNAKEAIQ
jgi:formate C-acetyltransferase